MASVILETGGAPNGAAHRTVSRLRLNAMLILGGVFSLSVALFVALGPLLSLGFEAVLFASFLLLAIFILVLRGLPHHPHRAFGVANMVTSVRTAIVSLVTATVLFAVDLSIVPSAIWLLAGLVFVALILDGFDGYLARLFRQESELGARFDMEVDALLILVLSIAGLILGKAGWWVLGIGTMRYGFIAAQCVWPALENPLPPSYRRKAICVFQVAALCLILLPVIVPPVSTMIALVALGLLGFSFAVDIIYLLRSKGTS